MVNNSVSIRSGTGAGPHIWAIGGGKGGIGKSFMSSSLAISLARMGKTVYLVDLDLGSANLHTCLGAAPSNISLSDFFSGRVSNLMDLVSSTELPNLKLISGFNDALNIGECTPVQRQMLLQAVRQLPAPYVILDLGAGVGEVTLDFFLGADQKIVAVTPEPTSIENAYRFIKSAFYTRLRHAETELGIRSFIESAMDQRNQHGIRSPADLIRHISQQYPDTGHRLQATINEFKIHLVLNQVRTRYDIDLGNSMTSVCRKYFGIQADFAGYLDYDNAVWQSLRKKRPLLLEHPHSILSGQFASITKFLLNPHSLRAAI